MEVFQLHSHARLEECSMEHASKIPLIISSLDPYMLQGGNGYVRGVRFENVRMDNVDNPIIIDQFYCDSPKSCQNQVQIPFSVLDSYLTIYYLITILVILSEFPPIFLDISCKS